MDQEPLNLIAFPVLLRFARDAYVRAIRQAQAAAECDDLPRNGTYVIGALARGSIPLSQIIDELGMTKQAAGQLVDTLVLRGYLEREPDPEDRRRLTLTLTERGEAAAAATRTAIAGLDAELTERVGAEHVAHTRETLAALFGLSGGAAPETPPAKPAARRFERQRMDAAVFHNCSLAGVTFDNVNLSNAAFSNVSLKGAKLTNVNLSGVEITDANISGLTIFGRDIQALLKAAT
jgi:DNA-binding MarR family transcriptional regulator